jgi:hypothetical protein
MFPLIGMGSNAGNITSPALRMLKEMRHVSKREDHIFDGCVADLSPLPDLCADVVQAASLRCMLSFPFGAFHDHFCIFSI